MLRPALALAALAAVPVLAGCRAPGAFDPPPERARVQVRSALFLVAADLADRGPIAWVDWFADDFRMASDGAVKFASLAAAREAMEAFAPTVASLELAWIDPRIDAWTPDLAGFGADYAERIVLADGAELTFAGHATGTWRRTPDGWRLARLHWSSPVPEGE